MVAPFQIAWCVNKHFINSYHLKVVFFYAAALSLSPYNKWVQSFNKLISSVDERELVNNESQSPTKQTHTKVHTQISKNT